jgi:invasion protein IalB
MIRFFALFLPVLPTVLAMTFATPATAQQQASNPAKNRPGGTQAALLQSFGDWGAYATPAGKSRICYALSQPKERMPKTLNRDPAYLFVSFRPGENVKSEVSVVLGFPAKDGADAELAIGGTKYAIITREENGWVKNTAEEPQVIAAMSKGASLTVKSSSRRGNVTTDRYALTGFAQALERVRKECQGS